MTWLEKNRIFSFLMKPGVSQKMFNTLFYDLSLSTHYCTFWTTIQFHGQVRKCIVIVFIVCTIAIFINHRTIVYRLSYQNHDKNNDVQKDSCFSFFCMTPDFDEFFKKFPTMCLFYLIPKNLSF